MSKTFRAVDLPWTEDLRAGLYELSSGRKLGNAEYTKSVWANACMQIRAMELSNLPWRLVKKNGDIVENHQLIEILKDFGDESNWEEGFSSTEIDKCRAGAAYWLWDVDQLKRLNPNTMEVKRNSNGIAGFKQTVMQGDKTITNLYSRDEIVYFRGYHPDDDLGPGIPITDIIKLAINTEYQAELMIQALFNNDGTPGILLTTEQTVPPVESERILGWWNRRFRGSRSKGKVGLADRGLKAERMAFTMLENDVINVREMARTDICVGFRVSKLLVSAFINSTYSNAEESRRSLIENLIVPEAKLYANVINQDLVSRIDSNLRFEFAPEELPIMQEDENERQVRLSGMLHDGVISDEYYRQEMGIDESAKPKEEVDKSKVAEDKWEKKAVKALLRGDSADVSFDTDNISVDRQYVIHGRLSNAKNEDAVRAAFK